MKNIYITLALAGAASFGAFAPAVLADEWNKQVQITFNEPVEIPGKVLAAGTYQFKLLEGELDSRYIVTIYNKNMTRLEAMVLAIPDQRIHAGGENNVIQFAERPAGSPMAIKAWYYPYAHYGLEFVYPHERASQLAKVNHEGVYSTRDDLSPYSNKEMKAGDEASKKMKHSTVKSIQADGSENDLTPDNTDNSRP